MRAATVGSKVYLRGLVEYCNVCRKNCYYCGIRRDNKEINRYRMTGDKVMEAVDFAWKNRYGSIVVQSGEQRSARFTRQIAELLNRIKTHTEGEIGITLSCGEQNAETYRKWFEAGARRYLLRIETSNRELYGKLHPQDNRHSFDDRLNAIGQLRSEGYIVGTGVMIGLPFQTVEHLADDLLFFQSLNVDMVGMGPYLEHRSTPLYDCRHLLLPHRERFELSLKMVAVLRLLMPGINIAATSAMQVLHPRGREMAVKAGANIIMPGITMPKFSSRYTLYENKPDDKSGIIKSKLEKNLNRAGISIGYGEWGD